MDNMFNSRNLFALVAAATAALPLGVVATPAGAAPSHPYEAIAGHYATLKQANAVADQARRKGVRTVVQVNGPGKNEVEYGNGYATPGPARALCSKVKAKGLPCLVGQEGHGVPSAWAHR
jgi:hypothetical protein